MAIRAGDPMIKFTYAEQCFIIAEAIEEGWVTGTAVDYYENGVKAMLNYYRTLPSAATGTHGMAITESYIDNYFTGAASYATAGSKTDRLQQIWMCKKMAHRFLPGQRTKLSPVSTYRLS